MDRAFRRANKVGQRLGDDLDLLASFPERPKGMWRRTYNRLIDELFGAEELADEVFAVRVERLHSRTD